MPAIVTDDGVKLHAEETGQGEPLLFVHEFAGDHRSFEPHLRFPAPVVAGELVDEQERLALAGLLGVQLYAVVGHDRWHRVSPYLAGYGFTRIPLLPDLRP